MVQDTTVLRAEKASQLFRANHTVQTDESLIKICSIINSLFFRRKSPLADRSRADKLKRGTFKFKVGHLANVWLIRNRLNWQFYILY